MFRVYVADLSDLMNGFREPEKTGFLDRNSKDLPDQRKEKIRRFYRTDDAISSLAAYGLLVYALHRETGRDLLPEFRTGPGGKPCLTEPESLLFNLSHCRDAVACIVGESEAGIDIQEEFSYEESLARQFCSDRELEFLKGSAGEGQEICRLWTLKEAGAKYMGTGLTTDFREMDFCSGYPPAGGPWFFVGDLGQRKLAVCVEKDPGFLKARVLRINPDSRNIRELFLEPEDPRGAMELTPFSGFPEAGKRVDYTL